MKILKLLNGFNEFLTLCFPFVMYGALHNPDSDSVIFLYALSLFLTTFICTAIIILTAVKKGVDFGFVIKLKSSNEAVIIILSISFIAGALLLLINLFALKEKFVIIWCILCALFSSAFTVMGKDVIQKIDNSPYFRVGLPIYLFFMPFAVFIGGNLSIINTIHNDDIQSLFASLLLVFVGVSLAYTIWHSYYTVDLINKTVYKEHIIFKFLFANERAIILDSKNTKVIDKTLYYILKDKDMQMKIYKYYSGSYKLREILNEMSIITE